MIKYLLPALVLALAAACTEKPDDTVAFVESQPVGIKNEPSFNKHYQGIYINPEDSSRLQISSYTIVRSKSAACIFSIEDIDSTINRSDIHAIERSLADYQLKITKLERDSVHGIISFTDTIFSISEKNLCRFYKDCYFLNSLEDDGTWQVKRLDLTRDKLSIGMIIPTDSLFNQYPVADKQIITIDSLQTIYTMKPSQKEFNKLLKQNFFNDWQVWIRQKN